MIHFVSVASVSNERRNENARYIKTLGLPYAKGAGRLAVVGGGPSINAHVNELRSWDGEIWAVNGTVNWCLDRGIDAAFYTIDAQPIENWVYDLSRIKRAVLCDDCDPSVVGALKGAAISLVPYPDGGPTSAAAADLLSIQCGYTSVTWFGCEGSFGDNTHAFDSFPVSDWIVVRIGGTDYRTKPEFLDQAKIMSEVIRTIPNVYSERSGGLLAAMVEHGPEYELIDLAPRFRNQLIAADSITSEQLAMVAPDCDQSQIRGLA